MRFCASSPRIYIWLAGVFLLCFAYLQPDFDPDSNGRLDTSLAIVQHAELQIDRYRSNTIDVARYHGHYYSITAPGQALLGVPVCLAYKGVVWLASGARAANRIGVAHGDRSHDYLLLIYLEGLITVAVPAVVLLLLFFWFLGYFSASFAPRAALTLALGLATDIFSYSRVFYSHVPAALLLFAGFLPLHVLTQPHPVRGSTTSWLTRHPVAAATLAGLALGAAELFEYPAAIIIGLILLYAARRLPRRLFVWVIVGALPGLLAALGYNDAVYHSPLATGYSGYSMTYRSLYGHGLAGLNFPPPLFALWGTSGSRYRGLFFLSPFLLLACPGYVLWRRRGGDEWLLFLAIPATYFLFMAMYPVWWAGWSVGPRFLIPALPFLAIPIVLVVETASRRWTRVATAVLMLVSAAAIWIETLGSGQGYPPTHVQDPLFAYSLPAIRHDQVAPNVGSIVLQSFVTPTSKWTVLPLGLALVFWTLLLFWNRPRPTVWRARAGPSGT